MEITLLPAGSREALLSGFNRSDWSRRKPNSESWWPTDRGSIFIQLNVAPYQVNGPKRPAHAARSFSRGIVVQRTLRTSHPVSRRLIGVVTFSDLIYTRETLSPDGSFLLRALAAGIACNRDENATLSAIRSGERVGSFRWLSSLEHVRGFNRLLVMSDQRSIVLQSFQLDLSADI